DLGTLGGTTSRAFSINDGGQIVGFASVAGEGRTDATLWSDGKAINLGTLVAKTVSGNRINGRGFILGYYNSDKVIDCKDNNQRAVLWRYGVFMDLNRLLPLQQPVPRWLTLKTGND